VSYGHRWNFRNPRWAIEATVGVGYAYLDYDIFPCGECGEKLADETKHYFGPTKAAVNLIVALGQKPQPKPVPAPAPVYIPEPEPAPAPAPVVIYQPTLRAIFVTPEVEAVKARSESGRAYLEFEVSRSEILPYFHNNAAELQMIYNTIESVRENPDALITQIRITGNASPEGSAASNETLSARRAEALRNHIGAKYGLSGDLIAAYGAGEDWAGLEELVTQADYMAERYRLLDIIRGGGNADARERALRAVAGGAPYRQMLNTMYPKLRRSDYTISYTVVPFTIEQGKEVIKTRPGTLSLNEMFMIAGTYEAGSPAFNAVFETAAQVFPDSDVANLNAAAAALNRGDNTSAEVYLTKVKNYTPEFWNNLGVLYFRKGDTKQASESFQRAGTVASENVGELIKHLQTVPVQ
jgi:outer membrane protein OmpA-like peptidoglycan-associated protein